jgi:hypothetical protein
MPFLNSRTLNSYIQCISVIFLFLMTEKYVSTYIQCVFVSEEQRPVQEYETHMKELKRPIHKKTPIYLDTYERVKETYT